MQNLVKLASAMRERRDAPAELRQSRVPDEGTGWKERKEGGERKGEGKRTKGFDLELELGEEKGGGGEDEDRKRRRAERRDPK